MRILPPLAALFVLVLAGCGSGDSASSDSAADSSAPASQSAAIPGGGLSIQEAIASHLDGPLMIKGYIVERDDEARLCSALLESSPPQCGEPSLRVDGRALAPSEEQVSLLGEIDGDTIVVSETAQG